MTHVPATLDAALASALARDGARPLVTFYDDATGERVELSATTLANWVSKTVNFLVDTCGVGPGSRVSLHLPRHWLLAVWALAADAVGAEIVVGAMEPALGVDVAVVGPEILSAASPVPDADRVWIQGRRFGSGGGANV